MVSGLLSLATSGEEIFEGRTDSTQPHAAVYPRFDGSVNTVDRYYSSGCEWRGRSYYELSGKSQ